MDMSNREIAFLVWLSIFVVYLWRKSKDGTLGDSFSALIKAFLHQKLVLVFSWAALWVVLCVQLLSWAGWWSFENLKSTLVWAATFAFVTLMDAGRISEDRFYFRKAAKDTVNAATFITFVGDAYTFSLPVELVMTPVLVMVTMVWAFSEKKPEYQPAHKLSTWLLVIVGTLIWGNGIYRVIADLSGFATFENAKEFLIPVLLSLAFLPYLFAVAVLMTYETAIGRISWVLKDPSLRSYALWRAALSFRLDLEGLRRWKRDVELFRPSTREDVRKVIAGVKRQQRLERNPPIVSAEDGWSPYAATRFLAAEGLETGDYHRLDGDDGEWWAGSPMLKLNDGLFVADNIAYYVSGDEQAARRLTLRLHVNDLSRGETSDAKFVAICEQLLKAALNSSTAQNVACVGGVADAVIEGRRVRMTREDNTRPESGYSRTLKIEHSASV